MAETYGVTRMAARQAIEVLKTEGLVRSEHGRGVFVRVRPKVHRLARNRFTRDWREREGGRGAYDVEMKQLGLEPAVELVEVGPVTRRRRSRSGYPCIALLAWCQSECPGVDSSAAFPLR
jgi:DNA-binding GntR family transcriptional regulator